MPKLASAIEAGLRVSLDGVKALRILQETHGLRGLKATCEEKIARSFEACSQHPDFGKISAVQLARILKREDLNVSREEVVLKGIFNWFSFSKDRHGFLGILLQHVDFESFSVENLLRIGRFTLSGPTAEELHRNVDEALQNRQRKRAQHTPNSHDFQPKRRCLKHWSPDLGASAEACWREVLPIQCHSLAWHEGHIYATDFEGNVLCWHPGDPATSVRKVVGEGVGTQGINDLGSSCDVSVSPSGEIFVLDYDHSRLVRFQDGCGHLVCGGIYSPGGLSCSPNGVLYWLVGRGVGPSQVQKLVGSTIQTVIASESLPKDLQFKAEAIFVTKDEVIYIIDGVSLIDGVSHRDRILRINPAESLEPTVVGQIPNAEGILRLWGLVVTEGGTIYAFDHDSGEVFAFRPGETSPSQVLQCPDSLHPVALLVHGRSLYVGIVDDYEEPTVVGVYEQSLPPELQLE